MEQITERIESIDADLFEEKLTPGEVSKWRALPGIRPPPTSELMAVEYHEAGHVVAAEFYGLKPFRAECDRNSGGGKAMLAAPRDGQKNDPMEDTMENFALGVFGVVGLADCSQSFEEIAYRTAVVFMAGTQAELIHAGINKDAGVYDSHDSDTDRANHVLRTILKADISLAWAQMQARHILEQNWKRVEEIASELSLKGCWEPS